MAQHHKQFAVIGLGRFGQSVCRTLKGLGHEVLRIDSHEENVRAAHVEDLATEVVQADATDLHALEELGIQGFDTVVVAIGTDLESSVLIVLNLIDLGVKRIVAKASHLKYGKVLERVGGAAIQIVYPEVQMGERVARSLSGAEILESIELDPHFSIVERPVPPELVGLTLAEANVRTRYGVTVIAIKGADRLNIAPHGEDRLHAGDVLVLIGSNDKLENLRR